MLIAILILQGIAVQGWNEKQNYNFYEEWFKTLLSLKELGSAGKDLINALKDKVIGYESFGELILDMKDISIDAIYFILEHLDDFIFCIIEELKDMFSRGAIPQVILESLYPLFKTVESWKMFAYEQFESILNWTGQRFFLIEYIKSFTLPFSSYFKTVDNWVRTLFRKCPSDYKTILRTVMHKGSVKDLIELVKKLTELVKNHKPKTSKT